MKLILKRNQCDNGSDRELYLEDGTKIPGVTGLTYSAGRDITELTITFSNVKVFNLKDGELTVTINNVVGYLGEDEVIFELNKKKEYPVYKRSYLDW